MQVIVITGASDGIGAEVAHQLAARDREQVALVLAARNRVKLEQVAAHCRRHGAQTLVQTADVGIEADCRALVQASVDTYGRLDVLINNAGMSAHALFEEVSDLSWYVDLMRVNHWGSVWCTHAALPHLKASRGLIVAVSSQLGYVGMPGRTAYCATKGAMNMFFDALRIELHPYGVDVCVVYPGIVDTEIRRRGYDAKGQPAGSSGLDEAQAMSVDTCARLLIAGMDRRQRDVIMTSEGKLARWLRLLAPDLLDRIARRKLAQGRAGGAHH